MADSFSALPGEEGRRDMDRVRRLLGSPVGPRTGSPRSNKSSSPRPGSSDLLHSKCYGVPLATLVQRSSPGGDGFAIPDIVRTIVLYLMENGLDQEGLFRLSGSSKMVERVRQEFDRHGKADLSAINDVMAVASALKLFLRELPDSVVPAAMNKQFVFSYETHQYSGDCVSELRSLVREIPPVHYGLLKYLCRFLVIVSRHENLNKMSPTALAIVFGPNLFRCSMGFEGLREQQTTNQISAKLLTEYDDIFKDAAEDSPHTTPLPKLLARRAKTPPPRPPPPKFEGADNNSHPVPSPRVARLKHEGSEESGGSGSEEGRAGNRRSPRLSDDETVILDSRAMSPFVLDSDDTLSVSAVTPVQINFTSELLEKVISEVVGLRVFGALEDSSEEDEKENLPTPAPRRKRQGENGELLTTVKDIVRQFEGSDEGESEDSSRGVKRGGSGSPLKSSSAAFDVFEKSGLIIGPAPPGGVKPRDEEEGRLDVSSPSAARNRSPAGSYDGGDVTGFGMVRRNEDTLHYPRRAGGPANRRSPTRRLPPDPVSGGTDSPTLGRDGSAGSSQDFNHNNKGEGGGSGDAASPVNGDSQPAIPPLDLSMLHGDGATEAQKSSQASGGVQSEAPLSSSPTKPKKKRFFDPLLYTSEGGDIETSPSPPIDHEHLARLKEEEEHNAKIRQLTKRIQAAKKKIKAFEEQFEATRGYKPSQSDKSGDAEMRATMSELNRARKDLKALKESGPGTSGGVAEGVERDEGESTTPNDKTGSRPLSGGRQGSGGSGSSRETPKDLPENPTMSDTLKMLLDRLRDKRQEAGRPEEINDMTRDMIQEEKLAVQKALLHFESTHGRPASKKEKETMRPLYDRYRNIKRALAKAVLPGDGKEPDILGDDKTLNDPNKTKQLSVTLPSAGGEVDGSATLSTKAKEHQSESRGSEVAGPTRAESNLHELSAGELQKELEKAKNEKKRLRKVLRDYEDEFTKQTGRKVGKEDRGPREKEYGEYKQVKATLRLLEALISKHK